MTHQLFKSIGAPDVEFSGDVAFFRKAKCESVKYSDKVSKILISDPQPERRYLRHFEPIVDEIRQRFPEASLGLMLHGNRAKRIEKMAISFGMDIHRAFQNPLTGLSIYEESDLHIGFRVHGHVGALKSGTKSYLLEQDGRGMDYGVSFAPKITVPAWPVPVSSLSETLKTKLLFQKTNSMIVPDGCVDQIFALIDRDLENGFAHFNLVSEEITRINARLRASMQKLVLKLNASN